MISEPVLLAIVAFLGALVGGFFKLLNDQTKVHSKLSKTMERVAKSSEKVARETSKGAKEAKERNGHLGEQNIKLAEMVSAQSKDLKDVSTNTGLIAKTLSNSALIAAEDRDILTGTSQVIEKQTVETQIVKEKK